MSMKHWRNDTDSKTEVSVLGVKPVAVPLLITNLTRVRLGSKSGLCDETPATNRLNRRMVQYTRRHVDEKRKAQVAKKYFLNCVTQTSIAWRR